MSSRTFAPWCVAAGWLLCSILSAAAALAADSPPPDENPPSSEKVKQLKIPGLITIFHGANWGEDKKYIVAIKEAGFTASGCSEGQIADLKIAGLKAFVFIWPHEAETIPAKHKNDDTVLCYFLSDRVQQSKWGIWADSERKAYKADPYHPAVFTMAPREFGGVDRFLPVVRARVFEYYHYHWDANRAPQMHFPILEMYRQESLKNGGVPIWRIAETRPEDMRKTKHTIFTSLAYGVRGFRYGGALFDTNKRDKRGVPTPNEYGKAAAEINRSLNAFAPVFETARNVDVFHTPPLPPGTKEAPADYWVRPTGAEIVMGDFADPKGNHFLVVANRDAFAPHEAKLVFTDQTITAILRMNEATGKWEPAKTTRDGDTITVTLSLEDAGCDMLGVKFKPKEQ
jgi:hypothetical protein